MMRYLPTRYGLLSAILLFLPGSAFSETVHVAVAANFKKTMQRLATEFTARHKHEIIISSGSTGKLYAQISNGAPFKIFLAADRTHPRLLAENGLAIADSQFTYAIGRLALWAPNASSDVDNNHIREHNPQRLAIANPKVAPYGAAAKQVLQNIGSWNSYQGRMAFGENVGQALAFVASGSLQAGFVALSQVLDLETNQKKLWLIPQNEYSPLHQDAILLTHGKDNLGAITLINFLQSESARETIKNMGYWLP